MNDMGSPTWEMYTNVKPRNVRYVDSVVSYLDILGFRELIGTRTPGDISRILRILGESVKPEPMFKSQKIIFNAFSDTVIRSTPATINSPYNFIYELRHAMHAQITLMAEGILMRGAVTIGKVVQSWRIIYGPAIVRAYSLESREGSPPRIVIDEEALGRIRPAIEEANLGSQLDALLKKDGSTTYLNYLTACEAELNVPEQEYPLFLQVHRDVIRQGLTKYDSNPRVLSKYQWLKDYHDSTLETVFGAEISGNLLV